MRRKKKFYVVVYDIHDDKVRERVSKLLEKYGVRINFSVFECMFTEKQIETVQKNIGEKLDKRHDTVAYYPICLDCYTKIVYQPRKQQKKVYTITVV